MTHTIPHRWRAALACFVFTSSSFAQTNTAGASRDLSAPIASRNTSPIFASLGVPVMRDATGLQAGAWRVSWLGHWASHSVLESSDDAILEIDGETRRQDLGIRVGLGRGATLGINVPWIAHDGGHLDSLIDGWHDFWGMPDGPRPLQAQDALRFVYTGDHGFLLEEPASGVGDVEVEFAWRFAVLDTAEIAAFAQAKLDTGDAQDFTGSGDAGYAAGLRASAQTCVAARLRCHAQFGVVAIGDVPFAPGADAQTWFGGIALAWAFSDAVALVGQIDAQGQVYSAQPLAAKGDPVWGTLGLRWAPRPQWLIEANFSEDLAVGSAPDITFQLGVARRF